jgi:Tol biopolymer transport system component
VVKKMPVLLFIALFFLSCAPKTEEEEPAPVPLDGRGGGVIAYDLINPRGNPQHQIYAINADGSANTQISHAAVGLNHLDWSPDGRRMALVGYITDNNWSIYLMDADGSNLTRLTHNGVVEDSEPAWEPGGARIAFTRSYPAQNDRSELWLMNADGSNQHWIGIEGFGPKWSPGGSRFVYCSNSTGNWELYTCRINGSGVRRLTQTNDLETLPIWSPDGSEILFTSTRDGISEIHVMKADGTDRRGLTHTGYNNYQPRWSPDGSLIAFGSEMGGGPNQSEICIMNADGSNVRQVTNNVGDNMAICPDWRPIN